MDLPETISPEQSNRLIKAIKSYCDHKLSQGHSHPQQVTIELLENAGFIKTSDTEAFTHLNMTFYLHF